MKTVYKAWYVVSLLVTVIHAQIQIHENEEFVVRNDMTDEHQLENVIDLDMDDVSIEEETDEEEFNLENREMEQNMNSIHVESRDECMGREDDLECKIKRVQDNIGTFINEGFEKAEERRSLENNAIRRRITRGETTSRSVLMQYKIKQATPKAKLISSCQATAMLETSILVARSLNLTAKEIPDALRRIEIPRQFCSRVTSACGEEEAQLLRQTPTCVKHTGPGPEYRTIDGTCNNKANPTYGAANIYFRRMAKAAYDDGVSSPREKGLPNCRVVSRAITSIVAPPASTEMTQMIKQWGQFIDHDMALTGESVGDDHDGDGEPDHLPCCDKGSTNNGETSVDGCLPITTLLDDYYQSNGKDCLRFVRSLPGDTGCNLGHREQFNQITMAIDGSNVYAADPKRTADLRDKYDGLLRTSGSTEGGVCATSCEQAYLPETKNPGDRFFAGDIRVNEQPALTSMHTTWMRYHNKIAKNLAKYQPSWDNDRIFYEARRIVGATMQHITYNEFLPSVLSDTTMKFYGLNPEENGGYFEKYDPKVDMSGMNGFAAAAFRFGHTLISNTLLSQNTEMPLCNHFFNNDFLFKQGTHPSDVIQGETKVASEKIDMNLVSTLTNHLFAVGCTAPGNDLMALNCQRGRDHGLPSWNAYRVACDLRPYTFANIARNHGQELADKLSAIYKSVDDIDVFVGGLAESPPSGSLLGPTFSCILGKQFQVMKRGDRFYYENNLAENHFTPRQLQAIRDTSLASVICDVSAVRRVPAQSMAMNGAGTDSCLRLKRRSVANRIKYYWTPSTYGYSN